MVWSIAGVVFQLVAGVMLAVPFIYPGKVETIDREWHGGRGKQWLMLIIFAVLAVSLIIFGMVTYKNNANTKHGLQN